MKPENKSRSPCDLSPTPTIKLFVIYHLTI
jgi:hypothetical protein